MRWGLISRSMREILHASVCISYDLCHRGLNKNWIFLHFRLLRRRKVQVKLDVNLSDGARPVANGAVPPAKPECPPALAKNITSHRYCKKGVNFRANVLNFACVSQKTELFMGCSVGFKYAKNALAAGALP